VDFVGVSWISMFSRTPNASQPFSMGNRPDMRHIGPKFVIALSELNC